MGILSEHARRESNCSSSAPFVILNALPAGFKRAIYTLKKILSREMKDCNKITHFQGPRSKFSSGGAKEECVEEFLDVVGGGGEGGLLESRQRLFQV